MTVYLVPKHLVVRIKNMTIKLILDKRREVLLFQLDGIIIFSLNSKNKISRVHLG